MLLGKPDSGGGVSVIIEGEVPSTELASTLGLLAGAAGAGSPIVAATITPEPPTLTEDELASWHDLDAAVAEHGAVLCEWFLVGANTTIAVGEWSGVEPRWPFNGSRASGSAADGHRLELFGDDVDHALGLLEPPRMSSAGAPRRRGGSAPSTPSSRSR